MTYEAEQDLKRLVDRRRGVIIGDTSSHASSTWTRVKFIRAGRIKVMTNALLAGSFTTASTIPAGTVIGGKITKIRLQAGLVIAME